MDVVAVPLDVPGSTGYWASRSGRDRSCLDIATPSESRQSRSATRQATAIQDDFESVPLDDEERRQELIKVGPRLPTWLLRACENLSSMAV